MTPFLGFRLTGPMASWGDVTVGDVRSSWPAPSASALTGLLAAAHGVRREDEAGQAALGAWRFAVRLDAPGVPMRDYHTVQSARAEARGTPFRTRRDELRRGKVGTKLTDRTYYAGQVATVLAWGGDAEEAAEALRRPAFFLCLGRRACPPAAPLGPMVVSAATIREGLAAYDAARPAVEGEGGVPSEATVLFDARGDGPDSGFDAVSIGDRRDLPISRGADWTFAPRAVATARWGR